MENMEMKKLFGGCYFNKKVLITGNTGFKGSWLSAWFIELGAKVYGISNGIPTHPRSLFEEIGLEGKINYIQADIRDTQEIKSIFLNIKPDFVFHLAAQPIVMKSYRDPVETMTTNIIGTVSILEALRVLDNTCIAVMITSDKCYDNVEWIWGYRESDPLGGKDPYSASKGAAELMIKTYYHSYFAKAGSKIKIASVRAGNVIGGGDWAESRIVPDCIKAWEKNNIVQIRNPNATRPWQHVLEPLSGYLQTGKLLLEKEDINGHAFNFGPNPEQTKTVLDLIKSLAKNWDEDFKELFQVIPSIDFHEAGLLKLNCDKASGLLEWKPVLQFDETARLTALWYKAANKSSHNLYEYTVNQILEYINLAIERNLVWGKN